VTNIAIIGEAWGEQEEIEQTPFVGAAGYELTRMLDEAGIHRADCFLTNTFNLRPSGNKIETLCGPKETGIKGFPALTKSKYVRQEFIPELERLADEIISVNPNVIIALGNTPLWALCGKTGISKIRGTTHISTHTVTGYKILPTFHPANVLRQWENRPIAVLDFIKAKKESEFAEVRRPEREIWIEPSLEDLREFYDRYINDCQQITVDIETVGNRITCIGFAPTPQIALVIPFDDARKKNRSYWPDKTHEKQAWKFVAMVLEDRAIRKTFQNGLYDIAFIWRSIGIKTFGATHDTMLLHHALQPEALKSLGFLGSIYTDEGPWKSERKVTTIKRDE